MLIVNVNRPPRNDKEVLFQKLALAFSDEYYVTNQKDCTKCNICLNCRDDDDDLEFISITSDDE